MVPLEGPLSKWPKPSVFVSYAPSMLSNKLSHNSMDYQDNRYSHVHRSVR